MVKHLKQNTATICLQVITAVIESAIFNRIGCSYIK